MIDLYRKQLINEKVDIWALGVMLYKLAFFIHPFDEESPLGILNMRYEIPDDSPFSDNLHKMIRMFLLFHHHLIISLEFLLVADPASRPDIFAVLSKVASIRHTKYDRKTPVNTPKKQPPSSTPTATTTAPTVTVSEFKTPSSTPNKPSTNAKLFDILDWQSSENSSQQAQYTPQPTTQYSQQPPPPSPQQSQYSRPSTLVDFSAPVKTDNRSSMDIPEYPPVSDPDSDIFPHLDTSPNTSSFTHARASSDFHLRPDSHHIRTSSDTSFNSHNTNFSHSPSHSLSDFDDLEISDESEEDPHHKSKPT